MSNFTIFTYMFKPVAKPEHDLFENNVVDIKESLAHKQDLFEAMFPQKNAHAQSDTDEDGKIKMFKQKDTEYLYKMVLHRDGIIVFLLANNKRTLIHTRKFTHEETEDHPYCLVIIDNRKDRQIIAIEQKKTAFGSTQAVAKILADTFNARLSRRKLMLTIDAKYHANEFWNVVSRFPNGIKRVTFVFPYPNLPAITEMVGETMRRLALETNSEPTQILNALDTQILNLDKDSGMLKDMIDACAASGKPILIVPMGGRTVLKCNKGESLVREQLSSDVIKGLITGDLFDSCFEALTKFANHIKLAYD